MEGQYRLFTDTVRQDHLMAVMRLGMEATPFDPASHTIGVRNIAVRTALLAKQAGHEVELWEKTGTIGGKTLAASAP